MLRPQLENADIWTVDGGGVGEAATSCASACAPASTTRVVGIGGGRRSTSPSTPPRSPGCRWWRSRPSLAHDGIASPVASLEEGGRKGVLRRADADRASSSTSTTCARSEPADAALRDRRRDLQPRRDRRLAARRARARRAGRRPRGDVRPHRRHRDPAPHGRDRRRRLPDRAGRGARALRAGDGDRRARAARAAAATTRSSTRSTTSIPGTARHGELAGVGSLFTSCLRGDAKMAARRRRLPDAPRAAAPARRPRARPRRSSPRRSSHAPGTRPGPLHDPRAPRPRRSGR